MDQQTLVTKLQNIRSSLLATVSNAENFERKLVGPRPADSPKQIGGSPQNVDILTTEILGLAMQLGKIIDTQHNIVGDFMPENVATGATAPRFG